MRVTVGRCNALQALAAPSACAWPDGTTTSGYRITNNLIALLLRHEMIREASLSQKARKKHRIVFVYMITDAGRTWIDKQITQGAP